MNGSAYYINMDANVIQDIAGNAYSGIYGSNAWSFVIQSTSVTDITNSEVLIYPNPTSGIVRIFAPENLRLTDICILDINGKLIKQIENLEEMTVSIDLSNCAKGIYIIKLQMSEKSYSKNLIIN